ncbi:MAG: DsbA family protein [Candidatus Doudnabacteria bacterium]|nr:DsbA family protein [Candidatus Doudnabacteria bacterium]
MNKNTLTLVLIVVLILGAVVGLGFWLQSVSPEKILSDPNLKGEKVLSRSYSHMTGSANAKVTVVEFADYQCPFCAASYPGVKTTVDKYKNNPDFNFVYRNFPLAQHPNAKPAAEAAEAAGAQGKFWEMEGLIYERQNDWAGKINATSTFVSYAQELGLDTAKFENDVKTSKYVNEIAQDYLDGEAWGVNSTPTFFLNGQKLDSSTDLDAKIAEALAK